MEKRINRRDFIKLSVAGTAVTTLAMQTKRLPFAGGHDGESPHRWAMVIDLDTTSREARSLAFGA